MRRPAISLALLAVPFALACSGGSDDPCAIETDQAKPASASAADLNIQTPTLECSGKGSGATLDCAGAATVAGVKCSDGFGFTVDAGTTRLLLRLKGGDAWSWGAALSGGEKLEGSITISGLRDPADPVPTSGMSHAASFALHSSSAVLNGKLVSSW